MDSSRDFSRGGPPGDGARFPGARTPYGAGQSGGYQRRDDDNFVVCRKHGKKRNRAQMREVEPGEWECSVNHVCRNMQNVAAQQAATMSSKPPPTAAWAPSTNPMLPIVVQTRAPGGFGGLSLGSGSGTLGSHVWCHLHGKRISATSCDRVDGVYYVCRDPAVCVSAMLKPTEQLRHEECSELLCARHNVVRLIRYLVPDPQRNAYVCLDSHSCRVAELDNNDADGDTTNVPHGGWWQQSYR